MPNPYMVPGDGLARLTDAIKDIRSRLSELERPTGTSLTGLVAQVQAALADIAARVAQEISAQSYTKAQIDSKVANPGDVTSAGVGTFNGGVVSSDVKARTLSVGYDSVYIDANNRMGKAPSARRFKTDVAPLVIDPALIDGLEPVQFRLIGAVEVLGDDAPVEVGFIAEQLDEVGLGQYVNRDEDGTPHGIAYDRLTVPLVATAQQLSRRVRDLDDRLRAIEDGLAEFADIPLDSDAPEVTA